MSFSLEGRGKNICPRITEMVKLFLDAGIITVTAFILLMQGDRGGNVVGKGNTKSY